jgi:hypothetical protein
MGILEEELKKRFSDKSEEGSVDSDALWGAISESLDMGQATRPGAYWNWARIGGIALLLGGIAAFVFWDNDVSDIKSVQSNEAIDLIEIPQYDSEAGMAKQTTKPEIGSKENGALTEGPEKTSLNVQRADSGTNTFALTEATQTNERPAQERMPSDPDVNNVEVTTGHSVSESSKVKSSVNRSSKKDVPNEPVSSSIGFDAISTPSKAKRASSVENRPSKSEAAKASTQSVLQVSQRKLTEKSEEIESESRELQDVTLQFLRPQAVREIVATDGDVRQLEISIPMPLEQAPTAAHYSKKNFLPSEIYLGLGTELLQLDFDTKGSTRDLNEFTKSIPGYSTSLLASWSSDKGLRLNVGIEYARLRSKFDYSNQEEIQYLDEDRLITFELDEGTGDTINAVYQDTWLDAIETRTIVHHNEFDLLSIPLSIGYERDFGRIGLGIDAGLSYGFFLNQKGRSIDSEGAIAAFDSNAGTKTPFKASLLSYSLTPIIDYRLSDALSIRLAPQVRVLPNSDSDFHGAGQSAMLLRLSGGIVYQLK